MGEEVFKALNEIIYYIDEYKKGNPEIDESIMKELAKQTKSMLKGNKIHFLYYKVLMSYIKLRIALVSYETIQDERFKDISNQFLMNIYMYLEYTEYLKSYLNSCIKNKEYEELDDAFILYIKLEELMQSLGIYTDDLYKILRENTASFSAYYPKNNYDEINAKKNEIEVIIKKLIKDPE